MVQFLVDEIDCEPREWTFHVNSNERFVDIDDDDGPYFSLYLSPKGNEREYPVYTYYPYGCFHSADSDFDESDTEVSPSEYFWKALWWWQTGQMNKNRLETINEQCANYERHFLSSLFNHITRTQNISTEMSMLFREAVSQQGSWSEYYDIMEDL